MKKIIAAFDGLKFSKSTCSYAIQLAKQTGAHLVGVFLEDLGYTSYKAYELLYEKGGLAGSAGKKWDKKDAKTRAIAINEFEERCKNEGITCVVHKDRNVAIRELVNESIYADLLIVDSSETLSRQSEQTPTRFIRDLLSHAQCPVLVVPREFKPIKKIVLLYDGEPSSVHAIKMFSYSLQTFKKFPAEVLTVTVPKDNEYCSSNGLMKELMGYHFPDAVFTLLKGIPETEIVKRLKKEDPETLVILGAYCRGTVSRWFRTSMADILIKDVKLPLFIAHNK